MLRSMPNNCAQLQANARLPISALHPRLQYSYTSLSVPRVWNKEKVWKRILHTRSNQRRRALLVGLHNVGWRNDDPSYYSTYGTNKCVCWDTVFIHVHCTLYCYYYTHMGMGKILRPPIARPPLILQTDRQTTTPWMCLLLVSSPHYAVLAFFSFSFVEIRSIYTQQRTERNKERKNE